MKEVEKDIPLTKEDIEKIKNILKTMKFYDFKINRHYWIEGIKDWPRHGVELEKIKNIFNKTELITMAFKRNSEKGFCYTLHYKLTEFSYIKICYFFDKEPIEIFNAILIDRNLDKAVLEKYQINLNE